MTRMLGVVMAIVLAGCVQSTPPPMGPSGPPGTTAANNNAEAGSDDVVCKDETPTGSMISRQVCRKKADADADREANRNVMDQPKTQAPPPFHP